MFWTLCLPASVFVNGSLTATSSGFTQSFSFSTQVW
jgi:hypothetical protein